MVLTSQTSIPPTNPPALETLLLSCAKEFSSDRFWEHSHHSKAPRPEISSSSHHPCLLSLLSHPLRSACPQHNCPHLFARDLKLLEIFKMSKTNSHRKKRNWEGQTTGTLADRYYIFFRRRNMLIPVWLLTESAAGSMPEIHTYSFVTLE